LIYSILIILELPFGFANIPKKYFPRKFIIMIIHLKTSLLTESLLHFFVQWRFMYNRQKLTCILFIFDFLYWNILSRYIVPFSVIKITSLFKREFNILIIVKIWLAFKLLFTSILCGISINLIYLNFLLCASTLLLC